MVIHTCKSCNYSSKSTSDFNRHLNTKKHKNNVGDNIFDKTDINIMQMVKEEFDKQNEKFKNNTEELLKEIQKLKETNEKLNKTNNKNTNKIIQEARIIKKSILTILNKNFRDTPPIEYIREDEFKRELEKEYNAKISDKDNKIFSRIFQDYENKKIIKTLSDIILKFVKKEDYKNQSVFNIDSSRANFATKIEDFWLNDKKGMQLKKYTIDKVVQYMINVLDIFRLRIVKIRDENMKNPTMDKSDFIMRNQSLLLELVSFLNNYNTHTKIIFQTCPELRYSEKLLELYDK
jgi:sugar-specific transcriptional regulator TrmB